MVMAQNITIIIETDKKVHMQHKMMASTITVAIIPEVNSWGENMVKLKNFRICGYDSIK